MKQQLTNYIRAGYPALNIVSFEEQRVEAELKAVTDQAQFQLFVWSITQGIIDLANSNPIPGTEGPVEMLQAFEKLPERSVLVARDLHQFFDQPDPMLTRRVKDALAVAKRTNRVLVMVGCRLKLPPELEKEIAIVEFRLPDREQLSEVIDGIATSAGQTVNGNRDPLLDAASGLTTIEAENAFALSIVEAQCLDPKIIAREKANTIKKNGILEIIETPLGLADIGGLVVLKDWLTKRKSSYSKAAKEYGLPVAKGVLCVGIPGSGKSLSAKATANILGVPLLKLDCGRLYGSLVGQSEQNMRAVIQTAEAIAPCVLFVDEVDKGMSGSKSSGSTDGGTSSRVFGSFLQWMQEKTAPVFVFATANDISQLPPEFLRKGRFDELFFLDLPDAKEREEIWRIQIARRGRKPDQYRLVGLANETDGFTGAEIEAVFTEAMFAAFDEGIEPSEFHIRTAIDATVPLSQTMGQQIDDLRRWAKGRARRASAPAEVTTASRKLA